MENRRKRWYDLFGLLPRNLGRLLLWLGLIPIAFIIVLLVYAWRADQYELDEVLAPLENCAAYDRNGQWIGTLTDHDRVYVARNELPDNLVNAFIAREDEAFFDHGGIVYSSIIRSICRNLTTLSYAQGASTITMQLARNCYELGGKTLDRKVLEMAVARRIEGKYSKDEILTAYLNRIYFGQQCYGIAQAADLYFGKKVADLTLAECATLAGIIYGPNDFSPIKHPEEAKKVRDIVLGLLKNEGKITEVQYQAALAEPIVTRTPQSRSEENYAMDLVRRELDAILEEEDIRLGGLVVHTTLDLDLQNATLDAINKHMEALEARKDFKKHLASLQAKREKKGILKNKLTTKAEYEAALAAWKALPAERKEGMQPPMPNYIQSAAVVMDNATGALLAVVGGRDAEESKLNRAIQSRRQTGSLFKPFIYATFFQQGNSADTRISDDRIAYGEVRGAANWSPRNSDGTYRGMKPASFGLILSRNTMSVRIGNRAGLSNVIQSAQLAGFHGNISRTPALYLGTWEASPLDIASAYSVFANGGVRPTPYIIDHITDSQGQPRFAITKSKRTVYSQRAANITSSILQQVCKPGGTAGRITALGFKSPCGGKTGTTNNYTNAWFAGYTSNLTCSVWVGFDSSTKILEKGYGGTLALPVWVDIMLAAQKEGYPANAIRTRPGSEGQAVLVCRESNQLAHSGCQYAKTAYFETSAGYQAPTRMCEKHIPMAEPDTEENIPYAEPLDGSDDNIPLAEPVEETDAIPYATPI